jgi:hypothetical protein
MRHALRSLAAAAIAAGILAWPASPVHANGTVSVDIPEPSGRPGVRAHPARP